MSKGAHSAKVWTIVVAGGAGSRYGGPKTLEILQGQRVLDWSLHAAKAYSAGIVLVVPADRLRAEYGRAEFVVAGGETRSDSVRNGLAAVPEDAEIIVIHDGARPLASPALFLRAIQAVIDGADGAIPVVAVVDTIKRVVGTTVEATVDRDGLFIVQTPQAFRSEVLRAAHAQGGHASDDAGLVEQFGGVVVAIGGEERNRKLTTPDDFVILSALAGLPPAANPEDANERD